MLFYVTVDPPQAPEAPAVSDVLKDSAMVTWQPPADDGGTPVIGYHVERLSGFSPRWLQVTKDLTPQASFQLKELVEDNTYQFRVIAVNKVGPSPPSEPSPQITAKDPWGKRHLLVTNCLINFLLCIHFC